MTHVAVVQMTSKADWASNQATVEQLLAQLPSVRPLLVVLPEAFASFGAGEAAQKRFAEPLGQGPVQDFLAKMAQQHGIWLLAGTFPIQAGRRYAAASLLYNEQGERVARYDKMHLFDAQVADQTGVYRESTFTQPGNQVVVVDTPFGRLGLAVCYDVRFPELFRAMRVQGAEMICLPSAFTRPTGHAHWEVLVRARAIENQVFMLAAGQWGQHDDGRQTYGHSMIVSPWGEVLAQQTERAGVISACLDTADQHHIRETMPIGQHIQFEVTFVGQSQTSD